MGLFIVQLLKILSMSQTQALLKTIKALRDQKRELIGYLRNHGSLADKARLINQKIWRCPQFDEMGFVSSYGWEEEGSYEPSRAVFEADAGPEVFEYLTMADRCDPENLKYALKLWGDALYPVLERYDFQGWER